MFQVSSASIRRHNLKILEQSAAEQFFNPPQASVHLDDLDQEHCSFQKDPVFQKLQLEWKNCKNSDNTHAAALPPQIHTSTVLNTHLQLRKVQWDDNTQFQKIWKALKKYENNHPQRQIKLQSAQHVFNSEDDDRFLLKSMQIQAEFWKHFENTHLFTKVSELKLCKNQQNHNPAESFFRALCTAIDSQNHQEIELWSETVFDTLKKQCDLQNQRIYTDNQIGIVIRTGISMYRSYRIHPLFASEKPIQKQKVSSDSGDCQEIRQFFRKLICNPTTENGDTVYSAANVNPQEYLTRLQDNPKLDLSFENILIASQARRVIKTLLTICNADYLEQAHGFNIQHIKKTWPLWEVLFQKIFPNSQITLNDIKNSRIKIQDAINTELTIINDQLSKKAPNKQSKIKKKLQSFQQYLEETGNNEIQCNYKNNLKLVSSSINQYFQNSGAVICQDAAPDSIEYIAEKWYDYCHKKTKHPDNLPENTPLWELFLNYLQQDAPQASDFKHKKHLQAYLYQISLYKSEQFNHSNLQQARQLYLEECAPNPSPEHQI